MYHPANECPTESVGRMLDSLVEFNPADPGFGAPERWPAWTDEISVRTGRAMATGEFIDFDEIPGDGLGDLEF